MLYVEKLSAGDAEELFELRLLSYQSSKEFRVAEPQALRWNASDEDGLVLGIRDEEGRLVSTLKGTVLPSIRDAISFTECELPNELGAFPVLLLGKAATTHNVRNKGVHSLLRYLFIVAARSLAIPTLLGVVYDSAPRTNLMRRLGYKISPCARFWYTDLTPLSQTMIAALPMEEFSRAEALLRSTINVGEFGSNVDTVSALRQSEGYRTSKLDWADADRMHRKFGRATLRGSLGAIRYPVSDASIPPSLRFDALLPSIDGVSSYDLTYPISGSEALYVDPQLEVEAEDLDPSQNQSAIKLMVARKISTRANTSEGAGDLRLVEPGVGRTIRVDGLRFKASQSEYDFTCTGVGPTLYARDNFVSVGRHLDGLVSLKRAEHRRIVSSRLEQIGCRASRVVGIFSDPSQDVRMLDGSISESVIMIRAFRSSLRVKQLDPIASYFHSGTHSSIALSCLVESLIYDSHDSDARLQRQIGALDHLAAPDDLARLLGLTTQTLRTNPDCYARQKRLSIIADYAGVPLRFITRRLSGIEFPADPVPAKAYAMWFCESMGWQLKRMRYARFLHDYHHPGVTRYSEAWAYTLVENNITLAAEFADLETALFVDDPLDSLQSTLQINARDVQLLRENYEQCHRKDLEMAIRVVESFLTVCRICSLIAEADVEKMLSIFTDSYNAT